MATAEKTTVTREVTTAVEEEVIVLTLTKTEAAVIRAFTGLALPGDDKEAEEAKDSVWEAVKNFVPLNYELSCYPSLVRT